MQPSSLDVIADALGASGFPSGAMSSPDGAVTLLVTDVHECRAIEERIGTELLDALLQGHRAVVERLAAEHGGEVVKVERDAVMISFASSHAALRCAVELQRAIADLDPDATEPLLRRAGLHSGFVIQSGEAVFGRNVVIAARITDQARAGEILVSAAVKEYTETDPSFRFDSRAAVHFRGVHGEHEMYGVAWR
ncbi:MAG: adenylate/guanylate cyclase domain-containing protein [Solirubrobacteraceae bacterium]